MVDVVQWQSSDPLRWRSCSDVQEDEEAMVRQLEHIRRWPEISFSRVINAVTRGRKTCLGLEKESKVPEKKAAVDICGHSWQALQPHISLSKKIIFVCSSTNISPIKRLASSLALLSIGSVLHYEATAMLVVERLVGCAQDVLQMLKSSPTPISPVPSTPTLTILHYSLALSR